MSDVITRVPTTVQLGFDGKIGMKLSRQAILALLATDHGHGGTVIVDEEGEHVVSIPFMPLTITSGYVHFSDKDLEETNDI